MMLLVFLILIGGAFAIAMHFSEPPSPLAGRLRKPKADPKRSQPAD